MNNTVIRLSYPSKVSSCVDSYLGKIPFAEKTVYDVVDFFEKSTLSGEIKLRTEKIRERIILRDVVNLHNKDGIKNIQQIKKMIQQIESEKEILCPSRLPNIKLVKTKRDELVLFDGHHSMLAYMYAGRKYLDEVPYLIVVNEEGYVNDNEILVFFGQHSNRLKGGGWRDHAINWQAADDKQLCRRVQKNLGELFDSIRIFLQ